MQSGFVFVLLRLSAKLFPFLAATVLFMLGTRDFSRPATLQPSFFFQTKCSVFADAWTFKLWGLTAWNTLNVPHDRFQLRTVVITEYPGSPKDRDFFYQITKCKLLKGCVQCNYFVTFILHRFMNKRGYDTNKFIYVIYYIYIHKKNLYSAQTLS